MNLRTCLRPFAFALALGAAAPWPALAGGALALPPELPDQTDRLIVRYTSAQQARPQAASLQIAQELMSRAGIGLRWRRVMALGAHVMQLDRMVSHVELGALAETLRAVDPDVAYAEPDARMRPLYTPNDPLYGSQWSYFEAGGVGAPAAWDLSRGDGVKVAVLDTGYRPHADLAANILPGYDFVQNLGAAGDGSARDADASDPGDWCTANSSWHGTHVAGTIAALTGNGVGVAGIAHQAKIVPVRVLGKCSGYTSDIADGIIWASGGSVPGVPANANPARVLNLSLGGLGVCLATTQAAIHSARSRNAVVVVAAGNSNRDASGTQPANCSGVIAVGATNRNRTRAWYSNYGALVDISAPGGDVSVPADGVLSTLNAGTTTPGADSYANYQGTSMAAPHVAGTAALMLALKPTLTPDQIEATIKSTARPFPAFCYLCGAGILNAYEAVRTAMPATPIVASVSPSALAATRAGAGTLSALATASASNGAAPYTYTWSVVNTEGLITVANAGSPTATFSASMNACSSARGTAALLVRDALGRTATATAGISFTANADGPPVHPHAAQQAGGVTPQSSCPRVVPVASVLITPSELYGSGVGEDVTVGATGTALVTDGTAPITYLWTSSDGISVANATSASARFSAHLSACGGQIDQQYGTATLTITDAEGRIGSATAPITLIATSIPGRRCR